VEGKSKSDASNNRGNWNRLQIIRKILEQHTGKERNQGTTKKKKKTAILGTAHILREVLVQKYTACLTRELTLHVAQIVNKEQLQQYIP